VQLVANLDGFRKDWFDREDVKEACEGKSG